ncbi:hypothetical protein [Actinomadura verrucosospora]|uniref:Uncharacterized protein n=1 Tax=Actinomadura verrucosospora TaxID=46165 RepID=A0A7D3ZC10_ACTVE|nr:hypothetical protein [Actinomadura verrucosospora]QKG18597.1 hypothetical protein ACTIVE_0231 [Actinomadura verrucosospora]
MEAAILGVGLVWLLVHFGLPIAGLVVALRARRAAPRTGVLLASGFCCKIAAAVLSVGGPLAGALSIDATDGATAVAVIGLADILSRVVEVAGLGLILAGLLVWLRRPRRAPHATDLSGAR